MPVTIGSSRDDGQLFCVESQEWTYGLDNTGTRFSDTAATYCLELSDGSTVEWSQTATANWAAQLTEWATNIQAAADSAGLQWFVEPRFVDNPNPPNIDGTINGPGGTPSGLPGAPSSAIAEALIAGGMAWRYVNFQICPGQPVPVRAYRKTSDLYGDTQYELNTAGAILGPINEFWICADCDGKDSGNLLWLKKDPENPTELIPAEAGEIPNCYEPCGTLALADSPPDRTCTFEFVDACDNNNQSDPALFTPGVTRRATICSGEAVSLDYFVADPNDPAAFLPYDLTGLFVDCASGAEIGVPPTPCDDFVSLGNMWHLKLNGPPSTLVEWWADPDGPMNGTAVDHDNVSNIFTNDGSTLNHVSGPADNSYIAPTFSVEGTNAGDFISGMGLAGSSDSTGTDQGKLSAFFFLNKDAQLRDGGTRTGERGGLWVNKCCAGDLELIEERTTDTTSAERGVFNGTVIPAGIHYAEAAISDLSAWWNLTLEASFDGGETYGPLLGYDKKPEIECFPVIKCKDSGLLLNAITGEALDGAELLCENPCSQTGDTDISVLCQCITDALMVDKPDEAG